MNAEWLHWYYLIYLLPAAVALLVLLMSGLGGHRLGHSHGARGGWRLHAHHGSHAGSAAHGSGAAHGAHGHGGHGTAGRVHGQPAGHPHGHSDGSRGDRTGPSAAQQLLGFFGVGRAPLTIVLGSMMIGWGLFGLGATELLRPVLRFPALFVGPALAVAAAGSLLTAKLFGELSARAMPQDESYAISREGLVGLAGKVVYPVTDTGGRVHVFDQFRTLHVASARLAPGVPPLGKGTEVIVTSLEPERGCVLVEPLGFSRERVESRGEPRERVAALADAASAEKTQVGLGTTAPDTERQSSDPAGR
jgi:membrane protein implicated in regulation of membrane protease activity